ncbi:MAG: flagellar hook protein FlgE [Clostridiales bacterium]|nr:flagellar hook protein FlgE [Clostridiales bacterium]
MMSSMTAAISGLKAHQTRMDVISNNIANVNTIGYKASRVTFKEAYNKQLSSATAPNEELGIGGTNPSQVGLGVSINSITTNFSSGSIDTTENALDVAIDGEGYLIVKNNDAGEFLFTRSGALGIDPLGNLVTASGAKVYGWSSYEKEGSDVNFNEEMQVESINIYKDDYNGYKNSIEPTSTSYLTLTGNINLGATTDIVIPASIYDSYGTEYTVEIKFSKDPDDLNTWNYTISDGTGTDEIFEAKTGTMIFSGDADTIGTVADIDGQAVTPGKKNDDNIITKTFEFKNAADETIDTIDIDFDFSGLTQYDSTTSASVYDIDGYTAGSLVDYSIGDDGVLTGIYSNGEQQPLAKIALATFANEQGLKRVEGGLYSVTSNSGNFETVSANTVAGSFVSCALELSNVDLSTEFTDMIITQRGFQANSKIISASDELLQELVNLKR